MGVKLFNISQPVWIKHPDTKEVFKSRIFAVSGSEDDDPDYEDYPGEIVYEIPLEHDGHRVLLTAKDIYLTEKDAANSD